MLNKSQITLEQNKLTPKWKQTDPNKYNRDSNQSVNVERKVPPIEKYNTNESSQKLLNTNELKIDHVNQRVSYAMPYWKLNDDHGSQFIHDEKVYRPTISIKEELDNHSEAEIYSNKQENNNRNMTQNETSSKLTPIPSSKRFSTTKSRLYQENTTYK